MYTLVQSIPRSQIWTNQLPIIVLCVIIAEMFYKFHSFTLECIAFLATWYVIDGVMNWFRKSKV